MKFILEIVYGEIVDRSIPYETREEAEAASFGFRLSSDIGGLDGWHVRIVEQE